MVTESDTIWPRLAFCGRPTKKVRIEQLVLAAEHLSNLRDKYIEAVKAFFDAQKNRFLLQQVTDERYPPVPESNG